MSAKNIIMVLEVLQKHSDGEREGGKLSLTKIRELVRQDYRVDISDRAVRDNIAALIELGYDIDFKELPRKRKKGGKDSNIKYNYYLNREFTDGELRLLIDGLLFSKYIPYNQCKELVEKLGKLSSKFFQSKIGHIRRLPETHLENQELFLNIEILDEAILSSKMVQFNFIEYGIDKKEHIIEKNGEPRVYVVSPHEMVVTNGRYYLVCSHGRNDKLYHYRLDYIRNMKILDPLPARPLREIKQGFDLSEYMAAHVYMYSGDSITAKFRADKRIVGQILDWFGADVHFSNETKNSVIVRVKVVEQAMLYWALQYGQYVEVLGPLSLRKKVRETVAGMWGKYEK